MLYAQHLQYEEVSNFDVSILSFDVNILVYVICCQAWIVLLVTHGSSLRPAWWQGASYELNEPACKAPIRFITSDFDVDCRCLIFV